MARVSNYKELRQIAIEWIACGERGKRWAARHAPEQRLNVEALKYDRVHYGKVPSWCDVDEYERSVQLLESIAMAYALGTDPLEPIRRRDRATA